MSDPTDDNKSQPTPIIDAVIAEDEGTEANGTLVDAIVDALQSHSASPDATTQPTPDVAADEHIIDAVVEPASEKPASPQRETTDVAASSSRRVLALLASGTTPTLPFTRLVEAIHASGAEVVTLAVPPKKPRIQDRPPRLSDLKTGLTSLAESLIAAATGDAEPPQEHWVTTQLRSVKGTIDAVVAVDPHVAAQVFPVVDEVWPKAVRVAVDGDYTIDPEWHQVPFDDLVVAHPSLGTDLRRIREGHGRLRTGGPIVGGESVAAKRLKDDRPQVVASFASMPASDVDSLLFQLSLARPERFDLLFLPSGRDGIDELVRTRAGGYGLRGKRPKPGKGLEGWIKGASVLVGRPSPGEAACAIQADVPLLLFATDRLNSGEQFLKDHGVAEHSEVPLTISVQLESLLPGGQRQKDVQGALKELGTTGTHSAAQAILEAAEAGRPQAAAAVHPAPKDAPVGPHDDELEDIGAQAPSPAVPTTMSRELRKAYLSEIILHEKKIKRQLLRAKEGHHTWTNRARLAANARDDDLARKALERVEGLQRIIERLGMQVAELNGLRDRFAGRDQLTEADRHAAARFMSPDVAATLDRAGSLDPAAFTKLELNEALKNLKDKLRGV